MLHLDGAEDTMACVGPCAESKAVPDPPRQACEASMLPMLSKHAARACSLYI